MASTNDITNDRLVSKSNNQNFRDNWDLAFKKDKDKDKDANMKPSEKKDV